MLVALIGFGLSTNAQLGQREYENNYGNAFSYCPLLNWKFEYTGGQFSDIKGPAEKGYTTTIRFAFYAPPNYNNFIQDYLINGANASSRSAFRTNSGIVGEKLHIGNMPSGVDNVRLTVVMYVLPTPYINNYFVMWCFVENSSASKYLSKFEECAKTLEFKK